MKMQLALALALIPVLLLAPAAAARPAAFAREKPLGVPALVVRVDLTDPHTLVDLLLANDAPRANSAAESFGDEDFGRMVKRARAAAVLNGTFFSKDAQKRVMGNMVRAGGLVKYSQWENAGTTFGLGPGNRPEMLTAMVDGRPDQHRYWTSLTAGPRLLRAGQPSLQPALESFHDPHVLGEAGRSALGFTRDRRTLVLASFEVNLTLAHEAQAMRALGCWEALNLDGGASRALAVGGKVVAQAGRNLTNVIAIYDQRHPAPTARRRSLAAFGQAARRPGAAQPPRSAVATRGEPARAPVADAAGPAAMKALTGFGSWLLERAGEP